jgi:hypothetical protein
MISKIDNWHLDAAAITSLDARMADIAFSFLASMEKLESISGIEIDNGSNDYHEIKSRIKEHGAAVMSYYVYSHQAAIQALQNVIESTANELKRDGWVKFDAFKNAQGVLHSDQLCFIRSVSNVLKHNEGVINRKSESGKYLIDERGLRDGYDIETHILNGNANFYIPDIIVQCYLCGLSMIHKAFGQKPHRYLGQEYIKSFEEIFESLIPDWLEIRRPNKSMKHEAYNAGASD